jgi:predicted aspartyl protease
VAPTLWNETMRAILFVAFWTGLTCCISASFAASPDFATVVPFDLCKGMICVQAELAAGKPVTLLVDTGDAQNLISVELAKSYGWTLEPYVDKSGKVAPGVFNTGSHMLKLGKLAEPVSFLAISTADMGSQGTYEGSLVYTLFKDRILQIDYPRHLLRVSAALNGDATQGKARGQLKIVNFHTWGPPIVTGGPFSINGKSVSAQIDTGYTGTILIYTVAIKPLGLSDIAKQGVGEVFPFTDGGVTMLAAKAQQVGFADTVIDGKAPVVYFPTPGVHEPDSPFEATVGNALFKNCIVTLNFHDLTLEVQKQGS